jgi:hypothetical protein
VKGANYEILLYPFSTSLDEILKPETAVVYGCETWSTIFREERLTVFEDGLLRMVPHGTKPHKVSRKCEQLHNEKPHNLHYLPNNTQIAYSKTLIEKRPIAHVRSEVQNLSTYVVIRPT